MAKRKQPTAGEILDSLTGHEERAVEEHFDRPISEFVLDPGMYRRALMFVLRWRDGEDQESAYDAVMGMRLKDVLSFFAEAGSAEAEESGKGEKQPEAQPESSSSSAS